MDAVGEGLQARRQQMDYQRETGMKGDRQDKWLWRQKEKNHLYFTECS